MKIDALKTSIASEIKKMSDPQVAGPSYNKKNLSSELSKAKRLTPEEQKRFKGIIKSEERVASPLAFEEIDFDQLKKECIVLLDQKLQEPIELPRLDSEAKVRFAKKGLDLHASGEICSFCGNTITEDEYENLRQYFKAEDVIHFQESLRMLIGELENAVIIIRKLKADPFSFYDDYLRPSQLISQRIECQKHRQVTFLEALIEALKKKNRDIFGYERNTDFETPASVEPIVDEYSILVEENNHTDLKIKKDHAKDQLRYHYIYELCKDKEFDRFNKELEDLNRSYENIRKDVQDIQCHISEIQNEIREINESITNLKAKSLNEEKLAHEINSILDIHVNFQLALLKKDDQEGFYHIKDKRTGAIRNITQLSTGEKNIIGFLYFLLKIDAVKDKNQKKFVIFDDPMTSNDAALQYVIIEELYRLIEKVKGGNDDSIIHLIIMTHNHHFYINLTNGMNYKQHMFLRLCSNGQNTQQKIIKSQKDDFKTSYQALWADLKSLNKSENIGVSPMCNLCRRITETYTTFNCLNKREFCKKTTGSLKFFNVNSHDIQDAEADLTGVTKETVIQMLKNCYEKNNSLAHFEAHWNRGE